MNDFLATYLFGVVTGAAVVLKVGYRAAVRSNGRQMISAGARRLVKGRW